MDLNLKLERKWKKEKYTIGKIEIYIKDKDTLLKYRKDKRNCIF